MFEKEINNPKKEDWIKITALLVHAARIDDNYSEKERLIIINFLKSFDDKINFEEIIRKAESDEENSNQILKYTQEIKKNTIDFKKKIIKILWKIILSDDSSDMYENTLMRRIGGLLYISDKLIGEIKIEVLNKKD
tara:strand:- start:1208 stop:1615 length:408 start_codon:yes stop_codon:yes gene_type:complete